MRVSALILAVSILGLAAVGCDMLTKSEDTVINYTQTVIYNDAGEPVEVLAADGKTYVAVGEATSELLVQRGLIRIGGVVRKAE